jgi:hypothetical protein
VRATRDSLARIAGLATALSLATAPAPANALPGVTGPGSEPPAGVVLAQEGRPAMPDAHKIAILIRTTLVALNHANRTDNYTVLHELGSESFQEGNSPEGLRDIFAEFRERDLDLGPVTVINPQLFREPAFDQRGRLRLTGFFPSQPEQVNFDLAFEQVDGNWRLFGIGVNTTRETPVAESIETQ